MTANKLSYLLSLFCLLLLLIKTNVHITTIKVIACELGLDIYYVNLANVKKNSELKMIFDHIYNNCKNGGMIVFEDIDAMTSIVKKRDELTEEKSETISNLMDNTDDDLNLSYFLNLLDGTLTPANSVIIMTTNHKDHLDPALIRRGRMDVHITMDKADHYQIKQIYRNFRKKEIDSDILSKIPEMTYTPADIIFHLFSYNYVEISDAELLKEFIKT